MKTKNFIQSDSRVKSLPHACNWTKFKVILQFVHFWGTNMLERITSYKECLSTILTEIQWSLLETSNEPWRVFYSFSADSVVLKESLIFLKLRENFKSLSKKILFLNYNSILTKNVLDAATLPPKMKTRPCLVNSFRKRLSVKFSRTLPLYSEICERDENSI